MKEVGDRVRLVAKAVGSWEMRGMGPGALPQPPEVLPQQEARPGKTRCLQVTAKHRNLRALMLRLILAKPSDDQKSMNNTAGALDFKEAPPKPIHPKTKKNIWAGVVE